MPMHAIHCCLYTCDTCNFIYTRDMNDFFASMVDSKTLEAVFHQLNPEVIKNEIILYLTKLLLSCTFVCF